MEIDLRRNFEAKDFSAIRYSNQSIKIIRTMPNKRSPFFNNGNKIAVSVWLKSVRFLIIRKESWRGCVPKKNPVEQTSRKVAAMFNPLSSLGVLIKPLARLKFAMKGLEIFASTI